MNGEYYVLGFILLMVTIVILLVYKSKEGLCSTNDKAPWIIHKTPVPNAFILTAKNDPILEKSVDPGAHIECQEYCKTKGPITDKAFQQICIDICLQKKWTNK
jgi:hypothetical protein